MRTTAFDVAIDQLIFNATPVANIADNAVTSPNTSFYVSLHTADPGNSGDQTVAEISYTGYARQPVARSNLGFTVAASGAVSLVGTVLFPAMTGGTGGVATWMGIGKLVSGAGLLMYKAPITPTITVVVGVVPRIENLPAASKPSPGWDIG